jgi:hypothetical protein
LLICLFPLTFAGCSLFSGGSALIGIAKIEYFGQSVEGDIIYQIIYTDGSTTFFTSPKGDPGAQGPSGEQGEPGLPGETIPQGDYSVRFFYRDPETGEEKTVEEFCDEGGGVTPPSDVGDVEATADNPALTFAGWNFGEGYFSNVQSDLDVGAVYEPADGGSYFKISLTDGENLTQVVNFTQDAGSTVIVDWGDGSDDTVTDPAGGSLLKHTYAETGDYWIGLSVDTGNCYLGDLLLGSTNYFTKLAQVDKITMVTSALNPAYYDAQLKDNTKLDNLVVGMNITFVNSSNSNVIGNATIYAINRDTGVITFTSNCVLTTDPFVVASVGFFGGGVPANQELLQGAFVGDGVLLKPHTFTTQRALKSVTLPNAGAIALVGTVFSNCRSLRSVVIPDGINGVLGAQNFANCYNLSFVSIPATVTALGLNNFANCGNLSRIIYHLGLTVAV